MTRLSPDEADALTLYRSLPDELKPMVNAMVLILGGKEAEAAAEYGNDAVAQAHHWLGRADQAEEAAR